MKLFERYERIDIDQFIFLRTRLIQVAVLAICFMFLTSVCLAQLQYQSKSDRQGSLKQFLQDYLGSVNDKAKTTRYFPAFVDLQDAGMQEVAVYLTGRTWCGSGGCTTLILVHEGSSYKVIAKIPITRPPIRILTSRSNGWHDISVWVQGGGIQSGYEGKLSFNGKTYPSNPSIPPAERLAKKVAGEVIVPVAAEGFLLYQ